MLFNEEESTATIGTCNKQLIKQLDSLSVKHTTVIETRADEHGKAYTIPKKWIKIRAPRQLSNEQRQKMKENAIKNFSK